MPRRTILTERQREKLFDLPTDEPSLLRHYILSDEDLRHIRQRRRPRNRLGFALQLCAFRYPGRLLQPGEMIPPSMLAFIGAQIGVAAEELAEYGVRSETRYQHSAALQQLYGYRPFEGQVRADMLTWLEEAAERSRTNDLLAAEFLAELRRHNVIVPAISTVERCCADALVAAERAIASRITGRLDVLSRTRLLSLLSETADGRITRFVWSRQFEVGSNSNDMNGLLDRLEFLRKLAIDAGTLDGIPPHRVAGLRRQGERYSADGMRDLPENRRLAILAACVLEWSAMLADVAVETHDRIVGKLYRACERKRDELLQAERASIGDTLKMLSRFGEALITAHEEQDDLGLAIAEGGGWELLRQTVAQAAALTGKVSADPLAFVTDGYTRFRRYAPRFLEVLAFRGGRGADSLLEALELLHRLNRRGHRTLPVNAPLDFARARWRKRILKDGKPDRQAWEIGLLFELRNALRSGDTWLADSRRYREIGTALVPIETISEIARLAVPLEADDWLRHRSHLLNRTMGQIECANEAGILAGGAIVDGKLQIDRLERAAPEEAAALVLKLYASMPSVRITDILIEVDEELRFTDAFTDLRTGIACGDRIGVMTVLLADGVNLGLRKMADACDTHTFWELLRIGKWHVREETTARALAMIVEAQSKLPMARFWGDGTTSSSDGQHFPAGSTGEALNVVNARYGNEPGLSAYSHVSDQYAPYSTQIIPATAHEAPYILDGLLQNDTGRQIREHYADTGGFTDHVFAICSVLGFRFAPRIRDLPDKRLYVPVLDQVPPALQPIGGRINIRLIRENWPDILRLAASMSAGTVVPSQILRKLAAYPRQNSLALALREVGRLERSIFMLDWLSDIDLQRRAQIGLNKGEAHHALKRDLLQRFGYRLHGKETVEYFRRVSMFKGRQFDQSVILLCVRWYLAYNLSLRDLEEMMVERGIAVDHTTVHRWTIRYSPLLLERFNRRKRGVTGKWHVDETYIKVRGQWMYLYRAIDSVGDTVEFLFSEHRDLAAAKRFFKKALERHGRPDRVVIDGSQTNREAILSCDTTNRLQDCSRRQLIPITVKKSQYLNNRIEQDHRRIKRRVRPMLGFKSTATARIILSGIEMVHMMRKRQARYAFNPNPSLAEQFAILTA